MESRRAERGMAMIMAMVIIVILVAVSTTIVTSSASHAVNARQATELARARALAEGGAALVLKELHADPVGPVKATGIYDVTNETTFVRSHQPFEAGDGTVRIELTYLKQDPDTKAYVPIVFADRTKADAELYDRVRVGVTGIRPTAERSIELVLEAQFVLFNGAIVSDAIPDTGGGTAKTLAQRGHIVFNDKGRPKQFWINGDMMSNGGIYNYQSSVPLTTGNANDLITYAGRIQQELAGTPGEIEDYTAIGSQAQLFDFDRFIAAARAGAGQEFTTLADFVAAMNAANAAGKPLEGITVLSLDSGVEGKDPSVEIGDIPGGINIRGTLLFNYPASTAPLYKLFLKCAVNINPADLSGLVLSDPNTYTSGYDIPYTDPAKNPINVDISPAFENFKDDDDFPAMMFNTGIVDQHGASNICGLVYGPSFIEIENKNGELQYFQGAVLGGAGIYIEGHDTQGNTIISFDRDTINKLATHGGRGRGLVVISWR